MSKLKVPARHKGSTVAHNRSRFQERELAENLGGKLIPRSGAGLQKGDVRDKGVLRIEAKTTKNKSFSVTRRMIEKIEDAALPYGEVPAMVIEFINPETGEPEQEVAVIPTWALKSVISE